MGKWEWKGRTQRCCVSKSRWRGRESEECRKRVSGVCRVPLVTLWSKLGISASSYLVLGLLLILQLLLKRLF
jgi:hypothetical protein